MKPELTVTVRRPISTDDPVYPEEIKRIQDVYDTWIIENLGHRIIPEYRYKGNPNFSCDVEFTYVFGCEEDAVAFKLMWT